MDDLDKLRKMAQVVMQDISGLFATVYLSDYPAKIAEYENLCLLASKALPHHTQFFKKVASGKNVAFVDARHVVRHILDIIEIEATSEEKIRARKIFASAEDKMKEAGLSFGREDYTSAIHNLNTALELVLKDKIGLPTTITSVNTAKIIDILNKHKLGPYVYLEEAKKRVLNIANKTKHIGFTPSKIDCINGIKAMEEVIFRFRGVELKLTEEIKKKIHEEL